jgi:transcriptional regulator with XRE-family HTH domain
MHLLSLTVALFILAVNATSNKESIISNRRFVALYFARENRPPCQTRTHPFRSRLHTLPEQTGLSQQQLSDRLGLTQRAYAHWERNPVALRPDQLLGLAEALNVSVEDLAGSNGTKKRGSGPTGKMKQLFEAASHLPRSQQQKLAAVLEAFVNQHATR